VEKPSLRIVRRMFSALADPAGVRAHRPGALERVTLLLQDHDPPGTSTIALGRSTLRSPGGCRS
jgi:hypothetical protein